jgi:trigger factor
MDILIPTVYREALEEKAIEPVAQPSVELVSHEPLVFTATVPLQPVIDLGDYQALRVPTVEATVKDEEVESAIDELRRRYGTIEPVDRPAQKGDIIRGNLKAEVDGDVLYEQDEMEFRATEENLSSLPGLLEALEGMSKGETKETEAAVPEDFANPALAGKTAKYTVTVHEVKEERPAALDDDFAKQVGEGFENVEALRQRMRDDLQQAADETARRAYETMAIDALVSATTIEYPAVMVDHEIDHILEEQAGLDPRDPRAQELYIQRIGKSEEEVRESVRAEAELRMRRSLVLSKFAEAENIDVSDEEIESELQTMAASAGEQGPAILQIFGSENGRDTMRRSLKTRRTLARLVEIAGGDGAAPAAVEAEPAAEAPASEEKPAPKARRSSPRRTE